MQLEQLRTERNTLWRVTSAGNQRRPAGRGYWFDNQYRAPLGTVVAQATQRGWIEFHDRNGVQRVGPGTILLFTFGDTTAYGIPSGGLPEPMHCEWVNLQGAGLPEHIAAHTQQYGPVIDTRNRSNLVQTLRRLAARAQPDAAGAPTDQAHAVHHFVMRLLESAADRSYRQQTPVQRAVAELTRRPEAVASLQQLADDHGCSREHLSRVFRETIGTPAQDFLTRAKLERALLLLRTTGLPLRSVAAQSGFSTPHTLARQVRRHTGRSPSQVRAQAERSAAK